MSFDDVRAQGLAVSVLRRAVERGCVAGAYLFEGPVGVGKQRAAIALAQALVCGDKPRVGCGACMTCRRIAEGKHADVRTFGPRDEGNRNIQVGFVREEILPYARSAPFEGPAAVVIFPDADISFPALHPESANALLKTLEEPRSNVHFALLAARPDRLLATIRSRCQRVRFGRLPARTIETILEEHLVPEAARGAAVALCDGRADRALELARDGAAAALSASAMRIDAAVEVGAKPGTLVSLAEELARADDLGRVLDALRTFYRDVTLAGLGEPDDKLALRHEAERVRERARSLRPASAVERVAALEALMSRLERNANAELALDALLFEMAEGAR